MNKIKTGVVGAAGKMGKALIRLMQDSDELQLAAAIEQSGHDALGTDAGTLAGVDAAGITLSDDLAGVAANLDLLLDFTIAPATASHLETCRQHKTSMVIGTTGLSKSQIDRLHECGKQMPIVFASNYSVGVNVSFQLAEQAARIFGDRVDVEIIEAHHRHKVDAPSGTAITLAEKVVGALGRNLDDVGVYGRAGLTGERNRESIGIHAIRGGDLVGEHTVIFAGDGERVEITHRAINRDIFAEGALRAATWVVKQKPGVYDMQDVLNNP